METVEIVLIIIGIVFFIASCFVQEKFSQKDIDALAKMSEAELKMTIERQVGSAKMRAGEAVSEIIDESLGVAQRGLEKETNKKIMAVSEYSDTILETMNKTHNEIMFLYSMLNDKQIETADMISDLQKITKQVREMGVEHVASINSGSSKKSTEAVPAIESVSEERIIDTKKAKTEETTLSTNEQILLLYKEGKDEVEIAKTLDCGLGVVRLVLGLYHET